MSPLLWEPAISIGASLNSQTQATSETGTATISTPAPFHVGPFARECQVAHLIGRVIQHVYHPVTDVDFRSCERAQLERTLKAFLPILIDEELEFSTYCGALGMCIRYPYSHCPQ